MVHDFPGSDTTGHAICCQVLPLESPAVPWSPPQSWRHFEDRTRTPTLAGGRLCLDGVWDDGKDRQDREMTRRALCGRLFENWKVPKALAEEGYDVVWVG